MLWQKEKMTKKTEQKAKVKGADAEQKVLKKIKDGNKASKDKSMKENREKGADASKSTLGKRPYAQKAGSNGQQQPVMNRR